MSDKIWPFICWYSIPAESHSVQYEILFKIFLQFFYLIKNRNVLVVVSAVWEFWTHTGLLKTHHTNTLKLFSLIQPITQSVVIQRSTGSAKLSRNIVNCVVLHQPAKAHVVLAKDTVTLKLLVDHVVLPGAAETASTCAESVKQIGHCHRHEIQFDVILLVSTQCMCDWDIDRRIKIFMKINFLKMKL